jgi:hypothetical protein
MPTTERTPKVSSDAGEKKERRTTKQKPPTASVKDGLKRIEYPAMLEYRREINATIMNMFLQYFNKMLNDKALMAADGLTIHAILSDESKFLESLPQRSGDKRFMDHIILFAFDGTMFSMNLQKYVEDGQYKHVVLLFSQTKTNLDDAALFNRMMFRSIELSNVKGSYLYMPGESVAWVPDAKLEKRSFSDVFLPKSITDDVQMYVKLYEKKERLMRYLMVGMPGTGKTEITLAIVNYLNSLGVTVIKTVPDKALKDKIELAELLAPSVFILDDIDMYLGSRSKGVISEALGTFLDVLDGTEKIKSNVGFVATTNSVDLLDLAAQRPGRFDKILSFDSLTKENVLGIIRKSIHKEFEAGFKFEAAFTNAAVVDKMHSAGVTGSHIYNAVKMLGLRAQTLDIEVTSAWLVDEVEKELKSIKKIRETNYMTDKLNNAERKAGLGFRFGDE